MSHRNRFLAIPFLAPFICISVVIVPSAVYFIWQDGIMREARQRCEMRLSEPIPAQDQSYFCQKGVVPVSIGTCENANLQLKSSDFEQIMKANMQIGITTHDEVRTVFSGYEEYCNNPSRLGGFYMCRYQITDLWPPILIEYTTATDVIESIKPLPCSSS